jgi:hypothetical protein
MGCEDSNRDYYWVIINNKKPAVQRVLHNK